MSTVEVEVSIQMMETEGKPGVQLQTSIAYIHFFHNNRKKHENMRMKAFCCKLKTNYFSLVFQSSLQCLVIKTKKVKPKGV